MRVQTSPSPALPPSDTAEPRDAALGTAASDPETRPSNGGRAAYGLTVALLAWMLGIPLLYLARLRNELALPIGVVVTAGLLLAGLVVRPGRRHVRPAIGLGLLTVGLIGGITLLPSSVSRSALALVTAPFAPGAVDGQRIAGGAVLIAATVIVAWLALGLAAPRARLPLGGLLVPPALGVAAILVLSGGWRTLIPSVTLVLVALPIGRAILRRAVGGDASDGPLGWIVSLGLGLGSVSLLWLAVGSVGLLSPLALAGSVGAPFVLARREVRDLARRVGGVPRALGRPVLLRERADALGAGALLSGIGMVSLIAALAPDLAYDSVNHHLAIAARFARQGSLEPGLESIVYYWQIPVQVLYAGLIAWADPVAAKALHAVYGVLAVAGTGALAAHLTHRPDAGLIAATIVAASSVVWWMAQTAYMDFPMMFYFLTTIVALVRWVETGRRGWLVVVGLCAGLAVPAKLLNVALAPILVLVIVGREQPSPAGVLRSLLLCGVPALLVWVPWPLRSFLLSGNPAFPWFNNVFRSPLIEPEAISANQEFGTGSGPLDLLSLPWRATFEPEYFIESAELGPHLLALSPLLVLLGRRERSQGVAVLVATAVTYALIWIVGYHQNIRYLLPILPIFAVLAAMGYRHASAMTGGAPIRAAIVATLFLTTVGGALNIDQSWWFNRVSGPGLPHRVVFGQQSAESWVGQNNPGFGAFRHLNATYGDGAQVFGLSFASRLYLDSRLYFGDVHTTLPMRRRLGELERQADPRAAWQDLRELQFTHIMIDGSRPDLSRPPAERPAYLRPELLLRLADLEYADNGILVYRLLPSERQPPDLDGERDLLRNGGFERAGRGGLEGWDLEDRSQAERGAGQGRDGTAAAWVDGETQVTSEPAAAAPGAIYRLRVHARSDAGDVGLRFGIEFLSEARRSLTTSRVTFYPDAEYRPFETFSTAPPDARYVRVYVGGGGSRSRTWLDDASLAAVKP